MLQPSLPTYICSFASPCSAATATTNILPCAPSSSPASSVLWSARSTGIGVMVTQVDGLNSSASQSRSASELTLPCDRVTSRSQTYAERSGPLLQPILSPVSSATNVLVGSPRPSGGVSPTVLEHFRSRLVASRPADVSSLLEADSDELLVGSLNTMPSGNMDAVRQLCNSPQLASIAKQLFPAPAFEAKNDTISRWRSQPTLLQPDQLQNQTSAFASRRNCLQSDVDLALPTCENVMRTLGQLGHAPAHRLETQPSGQYG